MAWSGGDLQFFQTLEQGSCSCVSIMRSRVGFHVLNVFYFHLNGVSECDKLIGYWIFYGTEMGIDGETIYLGFRVKDHLGEFCHVFECLF